MRVISFVDSASTLEITLTQPLPEYRERGRRRPGSRSVSVSVSDVLQRLLPQPVLQLREIQAHRLHRLAWRVDLAHFEHWAFAEGAGGGAVLAEATDQPVLHAGRVLDDVVRRFAVPDHAPAHRPAVAGAHRAAVAQLDAPGGDLATVVHQPRRPALMRFRAARPRERAVQHDVRPRVP